MQMKMKEAFDKIVSTSIELYGEPVTNRWVRNSSPNVVFYPTSTSSISSYFKDQELVHSLLDFDILDGTKLIGRLKVADKIYCERSYYLLISNGASILYELENYTTLVAVTIPMPDSLMVSLIISSANIMAIQSGVTIDPESPVFTTYKQGINIPSFRIYYAEDNEDNSFSYYLSEQDNGVELEPISLVKYTKVPLAESPSKQYMILRNAETGNDEVMLVENELTKFFPKYKLPIFPQILTTQLLSYGSITLQDAELIEPDEEQATYH